MTGCSLSAFLRKAPGNRFGPWIVIFFGWGGGEGEQDENRCHFENATFRIAGQAWCRCFPCFFSPSTVCCAHILHFCFLTPCSSAFVRFVLHFLHRESILRQSHDRNEQLYDKQPWGASRTPEYGFSGKSELCLGLCRFGPLWVAQKSGSKMEPKKVD